VNRSETYDTQEALLNLGCGTDRLEGAVNIDISAGVGADVVHDLRRFPWPFPNSTFSTVVGMDIMEHLPDMLATMEEISRICRPGAIFRLTTPHFTSANAYTDPTHCHQFGYFSFDYFVGTATHNHYTQARFSYRRRELVFFSSRKNYLIRRIANRSPAFYERHLCWILPAWFLSIELVVEK
jgi:SAM-dependent methyltransferase